MKLNKELLNQTNESSNSTSQESNIKILKSFYYKDASHSVKNSFLTIEYDYYIQQQKQQKLKQKINKSNGSISSVGSSLSSSTSSATTSTTTTTHHTKTIKLSADEKKTKLNKSITTNTNKNRENITTESSSIPSQQPPPSPSCILFVNQLVNNKLITESNDKQQQKQQSISTLNNNNKNNSILKEITETASDTYDGYDDYEITPNEKNSSLKRNKTKKNSTSSSTDSSTYSKDQTNLINLGYKLITKVINNNSNNSNTKSNNNETNLKKSDSSNSSSSINLTNTLNKKTKKNNKDQIDSTQNNTTHKMFTQSEFIYSNNQTLPHQQQFQLLNNKKLRKLLPFNSGLKNHGNTCFMNSVLQCLFHTSPLADFFITDQFQHDMQFITHHEKFNQLQQQRNKPMQQQINTSNLPQFVLTKHFYRLLYSMWRNTYDSNYSAELKHLIGYMNPTFAGGNQNDSHELCVWLLDKLSQELTIRIETPISPQLLLNNAKSQVKIQSSSFIEDLFQVQFKSTVICSKCNYQSTKHETDMMLSLPLPQTSNKTKLINDITSKNTCKVNNVNNQQSSGSKHKQRRSLYAHLILTNQSSIKTITEQYQDPNLNDICKSKFYLQNNTVSDSIQTSSSNTDLDMNQSNESLNCTAPFHVKIGVNIQITQSTTSNSNESINVMQTQAMMCSNNGQIGGESSCSSVSSTTSSISSTSSAGSASSASSSCCPNQLQNSCRLSSTSSATVLNPTIGDLRRYISATYQLRHSDLVFIDLNRIQLVLNDTQSIKDNFLINKYNDFIRTNIIDSMCIVELNCPSVRTEPQMPLINIIGINVYYETPSSYGHMSNQANLDSDSPSKLDKKCVCYGLPFSLVLNRDCSYSDLCKKLLEAQFKYFKDKIMLKYKDLVEKLFTLSLNDPDTHERIKLNPNDELPLYAECVEKYINNTLKISKVNSCAEYIKLNIEWRSFEDISNLFRDIDSGRPEFIHKSVRLMKNLDESELNNKMSKTSLGVNGCQAAQPNPEELDPIMNNHHQQQHQQQQQNKMASATLNDCFELFTQREELTDENSWMCPKCKKQTNASKKLCISSVPPILIIHLKRFFYKSKSSNFKLTTPVWFPICNLDISKYISTSKRSTSKRCSTYDSSDDLDDDDDNENDNNDDLELVNDQTRDLYDQSYVYDLFAVCNHKGQNMANGHYTAFCKNFVDTKWYCFDDATCSPLFDSSSSSSLSNLANLYNNGSTNVCSENAYILFYKKRNCMRNEKWWVDYVEKSLLDSDEFDRFVSNLESIELEQQKYQVQQQNLQQMQKQPQQHQPNQPQPQPERPLQTNSNNTTNKKSNGINKIRKWINNGNSKVNTPINNQQTDEELNALRRVLYDDQYNAPPSQYTVPSSQNTSHYMNETNASSNCTSVDSELVAIHRQAELQRIQQKRFEEAINTNYHLNKHFNESDHLPPAVNHYNETNKPTRLINKQKNSSSSSLVASQSGDSLNESMSNQTPVNLIPPPQQFIYNKEFKKPYQGYFVEYKIPIPPMPPTPNSQNYTSPTPNSDVNPSLESNERYYLNMNNAHHQIIRINEDEATTTEEINNVSSYHNNQSSSNFSTVDSLLSYPSDNEYMYSQQTPQIQQPTALGVGGHPTPPSIFNTNLVQEFIINNSKAFYTSNRQQQQPQPTSLTPIQEHQLILKNQPNSPQSPPYYNPIQANNKLKFNNITTSSNKQTPLVQQRVSNLKSTNQVTQNNTSRFINTKSIETPI